MLSLVAYVKKHQQQWLIYQPSVWNNYSSALAASLGLCIAVWDVAMPFCWHAGRGDTWRALSRTALPRRGTFPAGRGTSRQSHFRATRPEAVQGKRRWMHLAAFPTPRAAHRSCGTQGPLQDAEPELHPVGAAPRILLALGMLGQGPGDRSWMPGRGRSLQQHCTFRG